MIKALLYVILAVFAGKSTLKAIGEGEHYAIEKLKRDKEYFNLGDRK